MPSTLTSVQAKTTEQDGEETEKGKTMPASTSCSSLTCKDTSAQSLMAKQNSLTQEHKQILPLITVSGPADVELSPYSLGLYHIFIFFHGALVVAVWERCIKLPTCKRGCFLSVLVLHLSCSCLVASPILSIGCCGLLLLQASCLSFSRERLQVVFGLPFSFYRVVCSS